MGARSSTVRRRVRRLVRLRHSRRHEDHPRGTGPGPSCRTSRARPHRRQLLRRDRTSRLLHPEHRARHRLHQRSAAPGPQLLVPRHPVEAPRWSELHPPSGQRSEVPRRPLPAGRPHGDAQPSRSGQLRAELVVWRGAGPREDPAGGFHSFEEPIEGTKARVRSEKFADHYSQARQFYISQTPVEQGHIVDAFVFELSKCEQPGIRARLVANLRNVDDDFARRVAEGLRLDPLPAPSVPARQPITDLPPSPALSIVLNGPNSFTGRKIGALVTDGADANVAECAARGSDRRRRPRRTRRPAGRRCRHQRRGTGASPPEDRRRPVRPLRRRGHPHHRRGRGPARQRQAAQGLRQRRPRPLQVHRLHPGSPAVGGRSRRSSTTGTSPSTAKQRSPPSSNVAARCATGTARRASTRSERRLRRSRPGEASTKDSSATDAA